MSPALAAVIGILVFAAILVTVWATIPAVHNLTPGLSIGGTGSNAGQTGAGTVTQQNVSSQQTGAGQISGGSGGTGQTIVTTNPTVQITGQQAQNTGNTFSTSYRVSVGGGAFGSTTSSGTGTLVPGQSAEFLVNASGYHNAVIQDVGGVVSPISITASTFPLSIQMNKNASLTQTFYYGYANANLGNMLASGYNASTAQNITNAGTNGASYTITERLYGTSQASTQDMACVLELSSGTNVTSGSTGVQMVGSNGITVNPDPSYAFSAPPWYTLKTSGANDKVWTFDTTPISNSGEHDITLTIPMQGSKSMPAGATLYQTCYTKEYFIDSGTGKITYGVGDSQTNTVQSAAQYAFEAQFGA